MIVSVCFFHVSLPYNVFQRCAVYLQKYILASKSTFIPLSLEWIACWTPLRTVRLKVSWLTVRHNNLWCLVCTNYGERRALWTGRERELRKRPVFNFSKPFSDKNDQQRAVILIPSDTTCYLSVMEDFLLVLTNINWTTLS